LSRFVALVSGLGWHVQDLLRAAELLRVTLEPVPFPTLVGTAGAGGRRVSAGGRPLDDADGILVRMMPPGTLEQVVYRMDALQRLAAAGVPVLNPPRAVEASVDKYLSTCLIEAAGLPVPPTVAAESSADALDAYDAIGPDVVVKPLFGSEGRGIVRVESREIARRVFQTLERIGALIYLQKFVKHPGHDVRVFVLKGRVVGAIRRYAAAGEWRTNVAVGGRAEAVRPGPELSRLALGAAGAVGALMAGVDLLDDPDRGGPVVIEVNAVPGWRALAAATGVDVAAAVLDALREGLR